MERKGSCHLYWGLGFPVCLFTEFDNTEVVEKQRMNVISFSLCRFHLSVCIGFAVHPSRPCPWFPPLKFLSNTCWDWRAKHLTPPPPTRPTPSSHNSIDFIPSPVLPSSIHGCVGGARSGMMEQPHQCEPLHKGRVSLPLPFATVTSPPTLPAGWIHCLGQEKAKKKKKERKKRKKKKERIIFSRLHKPKWMWEGWRLGRRCTLWHQP